MLSAYSIITLLGFVTITFLYLLINYFQNHKVFKEILKRNFASILWLLFFFHLLTALALQGEIADVKLFATAGYALWHKIDIYLLDANHGTYPFLPFTIYPYALFWWLSEKLPILTFSFWVKTLLLPVLFLTANLIGKILKQNHKNQVAAKTTQLLLLTNPVIFLAVTLHGQADILLIYFFILSIWFLISPRRSPFGHLRGVVAGIFYAFSVMTKSWSIFFAPLLWFYLSGFKKKVIYFASFLLTIFLFAQLYKLFVFTSLTRIIITFFSHPAGAPGWWGLTALSRLFSLWGLPNNFLVLADHYRFPLIISGLMIGLVFLQKKKADIFISAQVFIMIVYFLTAGWGLQYSAWILPFAYLNQNLKKVHFYTLLSIPYLVISYLSLINAWDTPILKDSSIYLSILPWAYSLFWLVRLKFGKR